MSATFNELFGPNPGDRRAMNRVLSLSFVVHVVLVVALFVVPRDWLSSSKKKDTMMTISLGGTAGPKTTGSTAIGTKAVEPTPTPPPKRPEPDRPNPPAPRTEAIQMTSKPPTPQTKTVEQSVPMTPRPQQNAEPPHPGNLAVRTPSTTISAGLTWGGGGGDNSMYDVKDFCCPAYLAEMKDAIRRNWRDKELTDRGSTTVTFTILPDGTITAIDVVQSSGNPTNDLVAQRALYDTKRLPPLPKEFKFPTLKINLKFEPDGR